MFSLNNLIEVAQYHFHHSFSCEKKIYSRMVGKVAGEKKEIKKLRYFCSKKKQQHSHNNNKMSSMRKNMEYFTLPHNVHS
jgi:hypothetical protein